MTISERGIDRKNSILCVGEELGGMHTSALFFCCYKVPSALYRVQSGIERTRKWGSECGKRDLDSSRVMGSLKESASRSRSRREDQKLNK